MRDKPAYAGGPRGGQQIIRPFRPQAVGDRKAPVEIAQIDLFDRSEFVSHDVRLLAPHEVHEGKGIKRVGDDWLGAHALQNSRFGRKTRQSRDLVPHLHQKGNKLASNHARRSGDKNFHLAFPRQPGM